MKEPIWVADGVVYALQEDLLARYGGLGGVRDTSMLESALHRPRNLFLYGKPSLFDLAAAYAYGVVKNLPFIDGNKRAGFMLAVVFLEANGRIFTAPDEEVVVMTRALAAGEMPEKGYAAWLKDSCAPKPRRKAKR